MIYILPFDINRLIEEKQTEIDELIDDYNKEPRFKRARKR